MTHKTAAETAKEIRKELKKSHPNTKFSVRSSRDSMESEITIEWLDGPSAAAVQSISGSFEKVRYCSTSGDILGGGNLFITLYRRYSESVIIGALEILAERWDGLDFNLVNIRASSVHAGYLVSCDHISFDVKGCNITSEVQKYLYGENFSSPKKESKIEPVSIEYVDSFPFSVAFFSGKGNSLQQCVDCYNTGSGIVYDVAVTAIVTLKREDFVFFGRNPFTPQHWVETFSRGIVGDGQQAYAKCIEIRLENTDNFFYFEPASLQSIGIEINRSSFFQGEIIAQINDALSSEYGRSKYNVYVKGLYKKASVKIEHEGNQIIAGRHTAAPKDVIDFLVKKLSHLAAFCSFTIDSRPEGLGHIARIQAILNRDFPSIEFTTAEKSPDITIIRWEDGPEAEDVGDSLDRYDLGCQFWLRRYHQEQINGLRLVATV